MFRVTDIVLIAAMVSAAAFTYKTKHDAEAQLAENRALAAQIRMEEDSILLLKADWSLLSQPSRLQKLADLHSDALELGPIAPTQLASLDDIPERPLEIEDIMQDEIEGVASVDAGTVTGSVARP
ncbi:MAG: hypothetical protein K5872_10055 [Rhizobiaceae bacterium]|nr:hypothetical protein [Rhizobiaceae bacterium]MCV0406557.1 hypothetical protein [Rhizobiaceae bacterium]